ncbi:MAG: hypothetical protein IRZ16_06530 [Myxococcaceae bacterium]|nr:hypothetical protein [Myxococcaceae bacterium]
MIRHLRIAGVGFAVEYAREEIWPTIARGLDGFESAAEANDIRIQVSVDLSLHRFEGARALPVRTADGLRGEDYELCAVGAGFRLIQSADPFPLSAALKALLASELLRRGAVLVHGVGVARADRAALFSGPSGAGKSTLGCHARAGGLSLLADELVVLRRGEDGAFEVEGTPWNVGAPRKATLAAIGVLAHAIRHRVEEVPPTEVLRVLTTNILLPAEAATTRHQAFEIARAALATTRTVRLHFAPDPSVVETLDPLL